MKPKVVVICVWMFVVFIAPGVCFANPDCGGQNQRECTVFEQIPSCNSMHTAYQGKCYHCGRQGELPCAFTVRAEACDSGLKAINNKCLANQATAASPGSNTITIVDEDNMAGGVMNDWGPPEPWLLAAVKGWMGMLPDQMPIQKLSIPGTHDSGAYTSGNLSLVPVGAQFVKTQQWSVLQQLEAGIRYFDIRIASDGSRFGMRHGGVDLLYPFDDVVSTMVSYLNNNPSETIIMGLQTDGDPTPGSQSCATIWQTYMNSYGNYFVDSGVNLPTLGAIRGRILVLSKVMNCSTVKAYNYNLVNIIEQNYYRITGDGSSNGESPVLGSIYETIVSVATKERLIQENIAAASNPNNQQLALNYLSGTGAPFFYPSAVAKNILPLTYDHIGPYSSQKSLGVLLMDFPGSRMVYRIIRTNFPASRLMPPGGLQVN